MLNKPFLSFFYLFTTLFIPTFLLSLQGRLPKPHHFLCQAECPWIWLFYPDVTPSSGEPTLAANKRLLPSARSRTMPTRAPFA